jgi:acetoacetate decarboxylase
MGFPKKFANPSLCIEKETLVGVLNYESCRIATATMGYKYRSLDPAKILKALYGKNYLLKIISHVDGSLRVCELVEYQLTDIIIKGAWEGPASLELFHHVMAPVADLPIKKVLGAVHILSDLTLSYGKVIYDYLK